MEISVCYSSLFIWYIKTDIERLRYAKSHLSDTEYKKLQSWKNIASVVYILISMIPSAIISTFAACILKEDLSIFFLSVLFITVYLFAGIRVYAIARRGMQFRWAEFEMWYNSNTRAIWKDTGVCPKIENIPVSYYTKEPMQEEELFVNWKALKEILA